MVNVIEKPINCKDKVYKNREICFREEHPKKFLGNAIFIIKGFKKGQSLNLKTNNNDKYENKIYNFRERQVKKEINPEMKFGLNKFTKENKYDNSHKEKEQKTYFHGIETYFNKVKETDNDMPSNNENNKISDNNNKYSSPEAEYSDIESGDDSESSKEDFSDGDNKSFNNLSKSDFNNNNATHKKNIHDYKDTKEMSKLALLKCNLINIREEEKRYLRAGEGKFISDNSTNVRGIYEKIMKLKEPNLNQKSVILNK